MKDITPILYSNAEKLKLNLSYKDIIGTQVKSKALKTIVYGN